MNQKICSGNLYDLGHGLRACIYRPTPDLHFPLSMADGAPWRLLTWTIIPRADGFADYTVLLAPSPNGAHSPAEPLEFTLDTHFGARRLKLEGPFPFQVLEKQICAPLQRALLNIAGRQPPEAAVALGAVLADRFQDEEQDWLFSKIAEQPSSSMIVPGVRDFTYIQELDGAAPRLHHVREASFEGAPLQTRLKLDLPLYGKKFLMLGQEDSAFARRAAA